MNKRILISALILIFSVAGCITEPELKTPFESFKPTALNDGWEISTPSKENIDSLGMISVFEDFHNDNHVWQVRSMTVIRNGKIVAESYTKDESDRNTLRPFWSITKQVTGILVGIALDKGLITSLDDKIEKYLPEALENHPGKKNITVRDLLTMRSGIDYKNYGLSGDDSEILQQIPNSYLSFVLSKDLIYEPGTYFKYKDSDPQILSSIIQKVTGKKMSEWAEEVLFSKIGLKKIEWLTYKDGTTLGSFGINSTPRAMAKIAQLVLNDGKYNEQQIVGKSYIDEMVKPLVEAGDKHFGYLWWSYPEYKTYFMSGNGRQLFFVFPEKELIVAITSEPNLQGKFNLSTKVGREYAQRILALCD